MRYCFAILLCSLLLPAGAFSQLTLTVRLDSAVAHRPELRQPGFFVVPKTQQAIDDLMQNGLHMNSIRLHVIESALNNAGNLPDALTLLDGASTDLQALAARTDKLIFIFEKMPAWLSSSNDGSPAQTPGWFVLNTRPPQSWADWEAMVAAVTDRIVNHYGIQNAAFEIWNEPDLGSWTASEASYFELFRRTYDAIKGVQGSLEVGGPAVNYWGNHIYQQAPYGYLSPALADASLISELLDSSVVWNRPLDFVSWHNFNIAWQTFANAEAYLNHKCAQLGIARPPMWISEWNAPSAGRDTPLHRAFMLRALTALRETGIAHQMVAAWQDFEAQPTEFHSDYGMLTYGGIHKPAYHSLLLMNALQGSPLAVTGDARLDSWASLQADTLRILIGNYIPPALAEALNHTLWSGQYTVYQLDSAGYLDLVQNDLAYLDSIYRGLVPLPGTDPMQLAILEGAAVYQELDSVQQAPRALRLQVQGLNGTYSGRAFFLDDTRNNLQHRYDSLRQAGQTQATAIANVLLDQSLQSQPLSLTNGEVQLSLDPNALVLLEWAVPGLQEAPDPASPQSLRVYPNPTSGNLVLHHPGPLGAFVLADLQGRILLHGWHEGGEVRLSIGHLPAGCYVLQFPAYPGQAFSILKQ